jgi:hypothetical protein
MTFHRIVTFLSAGALAYFTWSAVALLDEEPAPPAPVASVSAPAQSAVRFVPAPLVEHAEAHAHDQAEVESTIDVDAPPPTDGPSGIDAMGAEAAFTAASADLDRVLASEDVPEAASRRRLRDRSMRALVDVSPYLSSNELARRTTDVRTRLAQLDQREHVHFAD